jgi:hypothetical protein
MQGGDLKFVVSLHGRHEGKTVHMVITDKIDIKILVHRILSRNYFEYKTKYSQPMGTGSCFPGGRAAEA